MGLSHVAAALQGRFSDVLGGVVAGSEERHEVLAIGRPGCGHQLVTAQERGYLAMGRRCFWGSLSQAI